MISRAIKSGTAGFTLIELLLAVFIFGLVISSVYGAYRATFHTIHGTEQRISRGDEARVIIERIVADLESLYTEEGGFFRGEREEIGANRADSFNFTSSAHLVFRRGERPSGMAVITYRTEEDDAGLIKVYRADSIMLPGDTETTEEELGLLIARGLSEFKVSYVSAEGDEQDEWDSEPDVEEGSGQSTTMILPSLVRVQIAFSDSSEGEDRIVFRSAVAMPVVPGEDKP